MKKLISLFMVFMLTFTGCAFNQKENTTENMEISDTVKESENQFADSEKESVIGTFTGLEDENLLDYVEGAIYEQMVSEFEADDYFVENVRAVYLSKEYIEELEYNSQSNVYFGYTVSELDEAFEGKKYLFTLGEDNTTIVKEQEVIDEDTYNTMLKNVLVGTGVILICVTVSTVTAGSAQAVSMIFAASAKSATKFAVSGGIIGSASAAIVTGYKTKNFKSALTSGLMAGSEGFKWGAVSGALVGGTSEAIALKGATLNGLTMNEAAKIQKESGYSVDVIKQFHSAEEYNIYKQAGLYTQKINGETALIRDIDLDFKSTLDDGTTITNLERMDMGLAPLDPKTGKAYQLHHIGQKEDGSLAILTEKEHQENARILNIQGKETEIDRNAFNKVRKAFWKSYASRFK